MGIDIKIPDVIVTPNTNIPNIVNFDLNIVLSLVNGLNLNPKYHIPNKSHLKTTKSNNRKAKTKEDSELVKKIKTKKEKKDKSIVIIIDESEKHKEELDEQVEAITLGMDGFEKIHLEQYEKQLEQYKRFLSEYLKEAQYATEAYKAYQPDEGEEKKRKFEWGQEVVTFKEIKDIVRRIQMNALMSGNSVGDMSGHNSVSWDEAQEYKFWKYTSKFNETMSFIIYDSIGSGG
ncbi:hypothetical protein HOC35_03615 [Candidatus Woesearchaeota archaeon]|jgi:hypothetical protein|nr:hypothetical protein [Candidatus Woesearchaeota archaeon]